jgi:alpha-beta hydrolase superfamily lysophospholipase
MAGAPAAVGSVQNDRGEALSLYTWEPVGLGRGVCVLFHGYGAHARYSTVQFAADVLCAAGLRAYCADMPGHGASAGTPGLLPTVECVSKDGVAVTEHVRRLHPDLRLFLCGTSMGGAIALNVSRLTVVDGVVLLAPMVKQSAANVPAAPVLSILRFLSWVCPSLAVISPNAMDDDIQYTDPERRELCRSDQASCYHGKMRLGTAATLLDISLDLHAHLEEISCPFWVGMGGREVVVDPSGATDLFERAAVASEDKVLRTYPTAQHGLLAEPEPLRGEIERDITEWLRSRLDLPRRLRAQQP